MMKRVQVVPKNFDTWDGLRHSVVDYVIEFCVDWMNQESVG
jgi:hypothetical protein